MPLATHALPYGLRDVKITPITSAGAYGTMIDLPVAQTLSWSDTADFSELRGDDTLVAERESGTTVEWDIEHGAISLEAYAAMAGGVVTSSGTTPNVVKTYNKKGAHNRPYFRADGQAIADNGGDVVVELLKCKATGDIDGEFADGEFDVTSLSGRAYPNATDDIYNIRHRETSIALVQPV